MATKTTTIPEIGLVRRVLGKIAPSYDIERVWLFGSCARGEQREGSDVDLCLETGPSFSLFSAGAFASEVERGVGTHVDIVTERSVYPHVEAGMKRDRRLVYER